MLEECCIFDRAVVRPGRSPRKACQRVAPLLATVVSSIVLLGGCGSAPSNTTISRVKQICRSSSASQLIRFEGVVSYSDRFSDRYNGFIVIEDSTASIRVRPVEHSPVSMGRRVAVSGRTGVGQDSDSVVGATLSDLGKGVLPKPNTISASDLTSDKFDGKWVTLTGVFQSFQQGHAGEATLEMDVGGPHVVAVVMGVEQYPAVHQLEDADVRVTCVLSTSANVDDNSFEFTLLVPNVFSIKVLKVRPDVRTLPLQAVKAVMTFPKLPAHRIRVRGLLPSVLDSDLTVSDSTGAITVAGEITSEPGAEKRLLDKPVDVVGFVAVQGTKRVLTEALVLQPANTEAPAGILTQIDSLLRLTENEARRKLAVSLDGVVTFCNPDRNILFMQDNTGGIFVNPKRRPQFRSGDHLLVSGVSEAGSFAPIVDNSTFRVVGRSPLPEPSKLSPEYIFLGGADSQWVELDGIIQRVGRERNEWFASAIWGTHHYTIRIPGPNPVPASWIDARVRVRGVCGSEYNSKRQFVGVTLFAPGLDQITVMDPAPSGTSQKVPQIKSLLQYSRSGSLGHRFQVRGSVTATNPQGPTWIQDRSGGIIIRNHEKISLSVGDLVDVSAFAVPGSFSPQLQDARIAKLRASRPWQPTSINGQQGLSGTDDSRLVQISAKLLNRSSNGNETILLMQAGRTTFSVRTTSEPTPYEIGSVLRVTGICSMVLRNVGLGVVASSFEIFPRSPSDLVLLRPAPWLTLQRALWAFSIGLFLIAAALTWVFILRRRVRLQTQVIAQKLSEVESLKEVAETANRAKSTFLANMSHEIRTPLTAILGYTQLLLRDRDMKGEAKAQLHTVGRSGEHLLGLINEVLDLSKIEAGRVELTRAPINPRLLFEDLEGMFRLRAESKDLQFEMSVTGEPETYVMAEEQKLRQILINLLGNAIKFTEKGQVRLRVEFEPRDSNRLWLSASVEDTGPGISPQGQAKLFEAFSQLGHRQGGTGLGLVISRKFAQMMGGDVFITRSSPAGTTFTLRIPLEQGEPVSGIRPTSHRSVIGIRGGLSAPSVLVVDDQAENRGWLMQLLGSTGFIVREAENGAEAVRIWKEWHPKLVLMDVRMPVMDGLEATRRIRADSRGHETAILIFTASALSDDRRRILESGANDFLPKPCAEHDLFEKIGALLGVQYLYEDVAGGDSEFLQVAAKIDIDRSIQLPADLAERLRVATSNGDKTLLDMLIVRVRETSDNESANILQQLSDNYEYDALTKLLEEVGQ